MVKVKRLDKVDNKIFNVILKWQYKWWGIRDGQSKEQVKYYLKHCISKKANVIPQTYIAIENNKVVGMYCITMSDDIERPDLYPYIANGYVEERHRGKGIYRKLMETVKSNCKKLGIHKIYCYTKHKGLYEKFDFKYIGKIPTFREDSKIERLYVVNIK